MQCGGVNKSPHRMVQFFPSITESKHIFLFILGKTRKQVEDKNNQFLRTGLTLVISSQPKKYNCVLHMQGEMGPSWMWDCLTTAIYCLWPLVMSHKVPYLDELLLSSCYHAGRSICIVLGLQNGEPAILSGKWNVCALHNCSFKTEMNIYVLLMLDAEKFQVWGFSGKNEIMGVSMFPSILII